VVLYRGDIARNGVWITFLDGSTASVAMAAHPATAARLFSRSTARPSDLVKNVRWLGDQRITFLWDDGEEKPRILEINLRTRQMHTLVRKAAAIITYDISTNGGSVVFLVRSPRNDAREHGLEQAGFVVTGQSIWSLLQGNPDGWTPWSHYETFTKDAAHGIRKVSESPALWSVPPELLRISPDGRYAISVEPARTVPLAWNAYTEHIFKDVYLPAARRNPLGPHFIRQYFLIDVRRATADPLWSAPENPAGGVAWAPDGTEIAIGPTFLPVAVAGKAGLSGHAVAVVNVKSGKFTCLPLPRAAAALDYRPAQWTRDGILHLESAAGREPALDFKRVDGKWQVVESATQQGMPAAPVDVELRQGPNTPPALYAVDRNAHSERLVRKLDPELGTRITLGRVTVVHWKSLDGGPWSGMLYEPVDFKPGRSFPLVLQTHGYSKTRFSLNGSFPTAFAAQALANRDIAVLQMGGPDGGDDAVLATHAEATVFLAGVEGALRHFIAAGIVDRTRVGIIGFSRSGWLVEYVLTHSDFPFAAAEVADNVDVSYVQYVLAGADTKPEYESDTGAAPFGNGLETWLRNAPGFNCDKIRAPLRLELDTGPIEFILGHWEIFTNLRRLGKPVELFVIPDIDHGAHILTNPAQRLASEGGTVDWFSFWLQGREDPSPAKSHQYARWERLLRLEDSEKHKQ
jgi:dipeptidyl aminopeptidase/acylaminoacyl peptidase